MDFSSVTKSVQRLHCNYNYDLKKESTGKSECNIVDMCIACAGMLNCIADVFTVLLVYDFGS